MTNPNTLFAAAFAALLAGGAASAQTAGIEAETDLLAAEAAIEIARGAGKGDITRLERETFGDHTLYMIDMEDKLSEAGVTIDAESGKLLERWSNEVTDAEAEALLIEIEESERQELFDHFGLTDEEIAEMSPAELELFEMQAHAVMEGGSPALCDLDLMDAHADDIADGLDDAADLPK